MKIKWIKLNSGEYESKDGRFHILRTYDVVYGNHWFLSDSNKTDNYRGEYHLDRKFGFRTVGSRCTDLSGQAAVVDGEVEGIHDVVLTGELLGEDERP